MNRCGYMKRFSNFRINKNCYTEDNLRMSSYVSHMESLFSNSLIRAEPRGNGQLIVVHHSEIFLEKGKPLGKRGSYVERPSGRSNRAQPKQVGLNGGSQRIISV